MRCAAASTSARSAPDTAPGTPPSACATSTTSAPSAAIIRARSREFPRLITATKGCPSTEQTIASPVPMLPEVSSTTLCPGASAPSARAASMIARAARSFFENPGSRKSSLHKSRPSSPSAATTRSSATSGVSPIASITESSTPARVSIA